MAFSGERKQEPGPGPRRSGSPAVVSSRAVQCWPRPPLAPLHRGLCSQHPHTHVEILCKIPWVGGCHQWSHRRGAHRQGPRFLAWAPLGGAALPWMADCPPRACLRGFSGHNGTWEGAQEEARIGDLWPLVPVGPQVGSPGSRESAQLGQVLPPFGHHRIP